MDQLQRVERSPLCFSSGLRASQDSFSGLNNDGAEMPTKMKTKDSLRRKRGRGKKKRGGGGGMWTTVTEEEGPGLCSPNMSGECMALTRTHTQYPPSTFIEPLHKSWQGPSVPSDLVVQTLVWPHRRFQQASDCQCAFTKVKGQIHCFLLKSLMRCFFVVVVFIERLQQTSDKPGRRGFMSCQTVGELVLKDNSS